MIRHLVTLRMEHYKQVILSKSDRVPLVICIIVACSAFPFSLLHYFLPQMLTSQFGISDEDLGLYSGLVDFADSFTSFISSAFIGYLSDVYGRKHLLILSLGSSFVRLILYAFIRDIWLLIATECLYGLVNCSSVMVRAILVEFSTNENRVVLFGYLTASYALSRSFSSLIGGLIVGLEFEMDIQNPYMIYSLLCAGLALLSVFLAFLIPEHTPQQRRNQEYYPNATWLESLERFLVNWIVELRSVYTFQTLLLIVCRGMISFASCTLLWTLFAFSPLRDYGLHMNALGVGIVFMIYGLISFCFQFFMFDRVTDRLGLKGTFILGGFLSIAQLIMLPTLTPVPYWQNNYEKSFGTTFVVMLFLSVSIVLYAIGEIVRPALEAMIVNTSDLDKQGVVQGISRMSHVLSDAVGSVVIGWLFSFFIRTGHPLYVYLFSATFYLLPAFIVYLMPASVEKHKSTLIKQQQSRVLTRDSHTDDEFLKTVRRKPNSVLEIEI